MIIDSHCHLEYEPMGSNLSEVVKRALKKLILNTILFLFNFRRF